MHQRSVTGERPPPRRQDKQHSAQMIKADTAQTFAYPCQGGFMNFISVSMMQVALSRLITLV